jgi:DNA-3-methyladenine glycosylase
MYNMFNIVTEREGFPAAVLVRAVEPLEGVDTMRRLRGTNLVGNLSNGPGKLCRAFGLDTSHSGIDLTGKAIYVSGYENAAHSIAVSSRIGIKQGTEREWRFYIEGNSFVSRSART